MRNTLIIGISVMAGLVIGAILLSVGIWVECRDYGHSFLYCLKLVIR